MMRITRRNALAAVAAAMAARPLSAAAQEQPAAPGPAVLTIAGKIAAWNRGATNPEHATFFKYHTIAFEKAFAFDRDMLSNLPQRNLSVDTREAGIGAFSGPALSDVLAAAGASAPLRFMALDGYAVEVAPEELAAIDWMLAIAREGKPFGIGDLGPAWLMHTPKDGNAPSEEEAQKWVWSVFYIEAI